MKSKPAPALEQVELAAKTCNTKVTLPKAAAYTQFHLKKACANPVKEEQDTLPDGAAGMRNQVKYSVYTCPVQERILS